MQENNFLIYFDKERILGSEYSIYGDIIKYCITINVMSMQKKLDISHHVFQAIFEHYSFVEYTKKELIIILNAVKGELQSRCMKEYPQEYYLNSKLKIENCGHLNKCYVNGYIEYCNVHKYDHDSMDHDFVHKTPENAMQEYNSMIRYMLYKDIISTLSIKIKNFIQDVIYSQYCIFEVEPSTDITNWLKNHKYCFKARTKNENKKITCYISNKHNEYFSQLVQCN